MRIGLDLDGCVFDFGKAFLAYGNRKWGTRYEEKDITRYEWYECLPDLTEEMFYDALKEFDAEGGWDEVPFYEGVEAALLRTVARGDSLHAITVRSGNGPAAAERAFFRAGIPLIDMGAVDHRGGETKADRAKQLRVDVHVEDRPRYCEQVARAGVPVILVTQRYNRKWEPPWDLPIVRAESLVDATKHLRSYVRTAARRSTSRARPA